VGPRCIVMAAWLGDNPRWVACVSVEQSATSQFGEYVDGVAATPALHQQPATVTIAEC
jgi:hypothetical protein